MLKILLILAVAVLPYDRGLYRHWVDADGDCQDTRAEILIRDNSGVIGWKDARRCRVATGRWVCPYTGKVLTQASDVDVDHVVPLKWAHEHGGHGWTQEKRQAFANDPLNLLAVDDATNQAKGSRGPSDWLPGIHRNEYLRQWGEVVEKYDLK